MSTNNKRARSIRGCYEIPIMHELRGKEISSALSKCNYGICNEQKTKKSKSAGLGNNMQDCDIEKVNLERAAQHISLSSSKLYHLFKQETGITFRQFIQHGKLIQSLKSLYNQENFT